MKLTLLVSLILFVAIVRADDTPSELAAARAHYWEAVVSATKPERDRYMMELREMKNRAISANNLKLVMAVDEEIKATLEGARHVEVNGRVSGHIINTSWSWIHPEEILTFFEDGTAKLSGSNDAFTWMVADADRLTIEGKFGPGRSFSRTFSMTLAPDFESGKGVLDGYREWQAKRVTRK